MFGVEGAASSGSLVSGIDAPRQRDTSYRKPFARAVRSASATRAAPSPTPARASATPRSRWYAIWVSASAASTRASIRSARASAAMTSSSTSRMSTRVMSQSISSDSPPGSGSSSRASSSHRRAFDVSPTRCGSRSAAVVPGSPPPGSRPRRRSSSTIGSGVPPCRGRHGGTPRSRCSGPPRRGRVRGRSVGPDRLLVRSSRRPRPTGRGTWSSGPCCSAPRTGTGRADLAEDADASRPCAMPSAAIAGMRAYWMKWCARPTLAMSSACRASSRTCSATATLSAVRPSMSSRAASSRRRSQRVVMLPLLGRTDRPLSIHRFAPARSERRRARSERSR